MNLRFVNQKPAVYVNVGQISHTACDFVLMLGHVPPDSDEAEVVARVVMPPAVLRDIVEALQQNLEMYEAQVGKIPVQKHPKIVVLDGKTKA